MRLMAKILLNAREVASDNTLNFEGIAEPVHVEHTHRITQQTGLRSTQYKTTP